jgi:hypothetical protein
MLLRWQIILQHFLRALAVGILLELTCGTKVVVYEDFVKFMASQNHHLTGNA